MSHSHGLSIDNLMLGLFTNAERFTDGHPLRKQAIVVLDALESVTNGMENPDVDGLLEELPADSPFLPWRDLIRALKAFYRGDAAGMKEHLDAIPASSPPKALERLLLHLSGVRPAEARLGRVEREIIANIRAERGPMVDAVSQITEALAVDNEAGFSDSVAFVVKELYVGEPETAKRLALWAMERIDGKETGSALFRGHMKLIFGEQEARRLAALSLMDRDPEGSLASWIRYFVGFLEGPLPKLEEAAALFEICRHLAEKSRSEGNGGADSAPLDELISLFETRFPGIVPETVDRTDPRRFFAVAAEACDSACRSPARSESVRKRKGAAAASPVQLDLFS